MQCRLSGCRKCARPHGRPGACARPDGWPGFSFSPRGRPRASATGSSGHYGLPVPGQSPLPSLSSLPVAARLWIVLCEVLNVSKLSRYSGRAAGQNGDEGPAFAVFQGASILCSGEQIMFSAIVLIYFGSKFVIFQYSALYSFSHRISAQLQALLTEDLYQNFSVVFRSRV